MQCGNENVQCWRLWKSWLYHSCVSYLFCLNYIFVVHWNYIFVVHWSSPNPLPSFLVPLYTKQTNHSDKPSMNRFPLSPLDTHTHIDIHIGYIHHIFLSFSHLLRINVWMLDCWKLSIFNFIDFFCFIILIINLFRT